VLVHTLDDVYRVSPLGGAPKLLNGTHEVRAYEVTPDGREVVFTEWQTTQVELFRVPVDGSLPPASFGTANRWLHLRDLWVTPDGTAAILKEVRSPATTAHLYRLSLDGSVPPAQLSGGLGEESVRQVVLSSDGQRLLYTAAAGSSDRALFSLSVQGGIPLELTQEQVSNFELSATGTVAYRTQQGLRSVAVDGSSGPLELLLPPGTTLPSEFRIGPRSERVFYAHERDGTTVVSSTPIDGSRPGRVHTLGGVDGFEVLPDGNRILYLSNVSGPFNDQLYLGYVTPPIDGRRAP